MQGTGVETEVGHIGEVAESSVGDFVQLMKPRVMSLVVFSALTGMVLAPGTIHPVLGIIALLAITIGAGASGALNMWYDADIDARMARTAARPIPRGRLTRDEALSFGVVLVNWTAGALLAITIAFYLFVYTMWLKRRTPQNIVIGGAAGAFPPMIGWAAVTGSVSLESVVLFLIIWLQARSTHRSMRRRTHHSTADLVSNRGAWGSAACPTAARRARAPTLSSSPRRSISRRPRAPSPSPTSR